MAVLFIIAAVAFDVGVMLLARRDQQNASDAAALAGARYVLTASNYGGSCAGAGTNAAVVAACEIALANGFDNSATAEDVFVNIPPADGAFRGVPGFVQVRIEATRAPIFGGIIGRASWKVGASAVAANQPGVTYSFGMLALDDSACKAIHISGSGTVNSNANVQSNSTGEDCGDGSNIGFSRSGTSLLNLSAPDAVCRSAGEIQDQGSGSMTCTPEEFSFVLPDPLQDLPAPTQPALAPALVPVGHTSAVPDWCPGTTSTSKPFNATKTKACEVDKAWIFSPGLYPAGISIKGSNAIAFLLPGIYWIGGGGFSTSNNGTVISVASGSTAATLSSCRATPATCTADGGVLIYNSKLPTSAAGSINLGGGGGTLKLLPYDYPFGDTTIDLVIFQDRTVALGGDDVTLNGSSAQAASVRGIIYLPAGDVKVNGSASVFTMDQVIAKTFLIDGSGGTVNVLRETGVDVKIAAVGLVE